MNPINFNHVKSFIGSRCNIKLQDEKVVVNVALVAIHEHPRKILVRSKSGIESIPFIQIKEIKKLNNLVMALMV